MLSHTKSRFAGQLRKIDSITFKVSDLDKSAKFYTEVLGLKQVWRDDKYKMIGFVFPESDSEIVIHNNPDIPNPDFSFLVDSVDEFVAEFKAQGYKVIVEPFEVRPGMYAVLSDLDGNVINIIDLSKFNNQPKYD